MFALFSRGNRLRKSMKKNERGGRKGKRRGAKCV